ncbi:hypothetical protein FQA47_016277 [Oryzias melastigma]|uniref:Helically-extended SH3 domain-containing protein n=2 Tax=Oryzias melastigma TaxID=30732 RepID=A0A834CCN1_ORYME|nr:hypothetical protein FQA47_016277 [Oryzias melastigma]
MDQEEPLDFKSIRAKFQESDFFLKQPKSKPALPEKPKVVPPPQPLSPTHFLPAGARASLLTSINQSLESKTLFAPRVVFKDDKKDGKTPLIHTNSKTKEKGDVKQKDVNNKTAKEVKEKLNSTPVEGKEKKENGKGKKFLSTPAPRDGEEPVLATPTPKATTQKRKGILGFKKSSKQDPGVTVSEPILNVQSPEGSGPASRVSPVFSTVNAKAEGDTSDPQFPLNKNNPVLQEIPPMSPIPAPQDFSSTPTFIPDIPAPSNPPPVTETPAKIENPALPVSTTASQNENLPDSSSASPTPPTGSAIPDAPVGVSAPSPLPPEFEAEAEAALQALNVDTVESPLPPNLDSPASQTPPRVERPISVLSALERAEDMSYGKRTPPGDLRILSALENARKKSNSPLSNPTQTSPSPEELAPPHSPTPALLELPPIDYEDKTGTALPSKPEQVNGTDYRQAPPVSEGVTDRVADPIADVLVVPTPPPRQARQDLKAECTAPDEPDGPLSDDFIPPPLVEVIPVPPEFSEEIPKVEPSDWENEEHTVLDEAETQNPTAFYSNGVTDQESEFHPEPEVHTEPDFHPEPEVHTELVHKEKPLDHSLPEFPPPVFNEPPPKEELQANNRTSYHDNRETAHEDIQVQSKKKGKGSNNGKKPLKKGTPKNPYVEASQEPASSPVQPQVPERTRTGRFGRNEKKTVTDGPDEKELKKKEKQRLEKEKKELKEKQEREKKEQKEREKREHEMKKKFKITGQEEAMYQARVIETTKGRKTDLPVKSGDVVSIIRTTKCPKGKWLARDSSSNYGYVAVGHVELDIKEMLELGKKTPRKSSSNVMEIDRVSAGGIATNHFQQSAESFSDDSEEWTCDDEEPLENADPLTPVSHTRSISMPDAGQSDIPIIHQHSQSDMSAENSQTHGRNEALQKLATFFHSPKPVQTPASTTEPQTRPLQTTEDVLV